MIRADRPLVLGSASPRRRQILGDLGIPLVQRPGHSDESLRPGEAPHPFLERVTQDKLTSVLSLVAGESWAGVIVADTIVVVDDQILGKPTDPADAIRLLGRIVGRTHTVYTRYLLATAEAPATIACGRTVETRVTMRAASAPEIAAYAATGEGLDKAGAYAAQGIGSFLIARIDGSYTNVVGLPACEVIEDLCRIGLLERYP
ncbi:MAG: septum formation protein Maf [Polyangiaceae bacterium]|nr:septum formation protein Maf [Polyangiaceae bacterium]